MFSKQSVAHLQEQRLAKDGLFYKALSQVAELLMSLLPEQI